MSSCQHLQFQNFLLYHIFNFFDIENLGLYYPQYICFFNQPTIEHQALTPTSPIPPSKCPPHAPLTPCARAPPTWILSYLAWLSTPHAATPSQESPFQSS